MAEAKVVALPGVNATTLAGSSGTRMWDSALTNGLIKSSPVLTTRYPALGPTAGAPREGEGVPLLGASELAIPKRRYWLASTREPSAVLERAVYGDEAFSPEAVGMWEPSVRDEV